MVKRKINKKINGLGEVIVKIRNWKIDYGK